MRKLILGTLVVVMSGLALAQVSGQHPNTSACNLAAQATDPQPGFDERTPRYRIEANDSFDLSFELVPEFNQTVTVQPDGFVNLREIGDMHVAGKTVPELTNALCSAYGKIMATPSITVVLKDFDKPYFVAGGQVGHPGKYVLRGDTTVTEAISMAGGFTEKSKHSQVLLFRRVSPQMSEAKVIDVKKMLTAKNLNEDVFLHPGDMIYVPQNRISKIARYLPTPSVNTYVNPAQY